MAALATIRPAEALFPDLPVTIGQVELRRESLADEAFLRRLYRSTREDELGITGWPDPVKQSFCDRQFALQHAHYRKHHPDGEFLVLRSGLEPVGRLYLADDGAAIHLVDIAVMPLWRGRGIGSALLAALQQRAAMAGKAVCLNVLSWNRRAMALYGRFGFVASGVDGAHLAMRWCNGDRFS
jgi:GNAT superfamily N-acetyltransferase